MHYLRQEFRLDTENQETRLLWHVPQALAQGDFSRCNTPIHP